MMPPSGVMRLRVYRAMRGLRRNKGGELNLTALSSHNEESRSNGQTTDLGDMHFHDCLVLLREEEMVNSSRELYLETPES